MRVDLAKLARNPVVLPHKQGVEHRQHLEVISNLIFSSGFQKSNIEVIDLVRYRSSMEEDECCSLTQGLKTF